MSIKQVVLQNSKLEVKLEMYNELKKYIFNFSSDDSKRTTVESPQAVTTATDAKNSAPSEHSPKLKTTEAQ